MTLLPPGIAFLLGAALGGWLMFVLLRIVGRLRTDRDRVLARVNRAKAYAPPLPAGPDAATAALDAQRKKTLIGHAVKQCNCIGFTFGKGDWEIDTDHVTEILADGYHGVPEGKAHVCNVIVWGDPDRGYDHAGLVVEVTPAGLPKVIRSKSATSRFIYEHPADVAPYGADFQIYERNSLPAPGTAARQAIDAAQAAYDAIADKTSRAAHDAATLLCQRKNALRGA
jgi:hypothetical protein